MKNNRILILLIALMAASLLLTGCGSSNSSSGGGGGNKTINMAGGDGYGSYGGDGGDFYIYTYRDGKVESSGNVDASFDTPPAANLPKYMAGLVELNVTSDMTVNSVSAGDAIPAGSYFIRFANNYIEFDSDGDGVAEAGDDDVDSIHVARGATLTIEPNYDYVGDGDANESTGSDAVFFYVYGDVKVEGTITTAMVNASASPDCTTCLDMSDLRIYANDIHVTSSGVITTAGGDNASGNGGHGGWMDLEAYLNDGGTFINEGQIITSGGDASGVDADSGDGGAAGYVYCWADGIMINKGNSIHADGGDSAEEDGGYAGDVSLSSDTHVYSTGAIFATGGNGLVDGDGGSGGDLYFYSYAGSINLSGDMDVHGGDGAWDGGSGGDFDIYNDYAAPVRISSDLVLYGGSATIDGDAGSSGDLYIYAYGGPVLMSGDLDAHGGDADGQYNSGGDGGDFYVYVDYSWDYEYGEEIDPGDVEISMDIDMSGGDGYYAGYGGDMDLYNDNYSDYVYPPSGSVLLKGYTAVDVSGGGDLSGGDGGYGGDFEIATEDAYSEIGYYYVVGSAINEADIDAHGGVGTYGGNGGEGGYIDMEAEGEAYVRDSDFTVCRNSGDININGGDGYYGGDSGGVYFYGYNEMNNSGDIEANGGNGIWDAGDGLYDYVEMYATENVINTGRITGNGGDTMVDDGGDVDYVYMYAGRLVKNSGAIEANGGDGQDSGGDGAYIDLFSQADATRNNASISVIGGEANNPDNDGSNGDIYIDWNNVTTVAGTN